MLQYDYLALWIEVIKLFSQDVFYTGVSKGIIQIIITEIPQYVSTYMYMQTWNVKQVSNQNLSISEN